MKSIKNNDLLLLSLLLFAVAPLVMATSLVGPQADPRLTPKYRWNYSTSEFQCPGDPPYGRKAF